MVKGHALLVGLKHVDKYSYGGWDGTSGCTGCELDIDNMNRILNSEGYDTKILKTSEATRNNILSCLYRSADTLISGDIFVFYYSGHGGQQPDIDGDELDGKDETLVVYDREIIDDKINYALTKFKAGVRIIMISDSCNSGTNYRGRVTIPKNKQTVLKPLSKNTETIKAQLIHLSGCRDGFYSNGYDGGGAFTIALCKAWKNATFGGTINTPFDGTMKDLHKKISELIESKQIPQYNEYGPVTDEFKSQKAFKINVTEPIEGYTELTVKEMKAEPAPIGKPKGSYKFIVKRGQDGLITEIEAKVE